MGSLCQISSDGLVSAKIITNFLKKKILVSA